MSNRLVAAVVATCLAVPLAAAAQQGRSSIRLVSIRPEPDRPTLTTALSELTNSGGARTEAQLQKLLAAHPDAGMIRALYAGTSEGLVPAERRRQLDQAVADAAKASSAELVLAAAIRDFRAGRTSAALTLIDAAAHLLPDEPVVEWFRIIMHPQPSAAGLQAAEAAHQKFPDDPGLLNLLAYARYQNGFKQEGLALARQYVQLMPEHPNSHDTYAELLTMDGKLAEAEQEYRRALQLDSTWYTGYIGLAEVALARGDAHGARAQVEAALPFTHEHGERVVVLRQAAFAAALEGRLPAMRSYFREAMECAQSGGDLVAARDTRWWQALVEAALGNRREVEALYADPGIEAPAHAYAGLARVGVFALLGVASEMDAGLAVQEQAAAEAGNTGPRQEALHLARLMRASASGDLAGARAELAKLETPDNVAWGNTYLAHALRRANDRAGAAAAKAAAEAGHVALDGHRTVQLLLLK